MNLRECSRSDSFARQGTTEVGTRIFSVVVCVAAFLICCTALHRALPAPEIKLVTPKLRHLAQHHVDYDAVFVGSSHVYRGLIPSVFDKVMADAGQPTHSFNFGIDGMWPPEQFYLMDRILELRPRNWRWVFIELSDVQFKRVPGEEDTQRDVYWHDWHHTFTVIRKLLDLNSPGNWKRKKGGLVRWHGAVWMHLELLCRNLANVGGAQAALDGFARWGNERAGGDSDLGPAGDGYDPVDVHLDAPAARSFEAWLARDVANSKPRIVDPYAEKAFLNYARRFRALGATPIFFTAPGSMSLLPSKFRSPSAPPIMVFNDPVTFPALYRAEFRWNEGHVNDAGAHEYSRVFARRVLSLETGK